MKILRDVAVVSLLSVAVSFEAGGAINYTWNNAAGGNLQDSANYTPSAGSYVFPIYAGSVYFDLNAAYTLTVTNDITASQGTQTFRAGNVELALGGHRWDLKSTSPLFSNSTGSPVVKLTSGSLTGINSLTVGDSATSDCHATFIADGASSSVTMNNVLTVGSKGDDNVCVVTNGAAVTGVKYLRVGYDGAASRNLLHISGDGSSISAIITTPSVGNVGTGNVMRISNWATATVKGINVGDGASSWNSRLEVTGGATLDLSSGSLLVGFSGGGASATVDAATVTNANAVKIGGGSSDNRLELVNGTQFYNISSCTVGAAGKTNNMILVSGVGTSFKNNAYDLTWAAGASNSVVRIEDGACAEFKRLVTVGTTTGAGNVLVVSNGTVRTSFAINVTGDSLLEISGHQALAEVYNSSKDVSNIYSGSTLRFVSDREGFGRFTSTYNVTFAAGAKLEIDARAVAKAGGGTFDLISLLDNRSITYPAQLDVTVVPENCTVTTSVKSKLTVTVPSARKGLILVFR